MKLMKDLLTSLAKSVLVLLRTTAAPSAINGDIEKKIFGSGSIIKLTFSNQEKDDFSKIVKSLEKSDLLIKVISEAIKNKVKEKRGNFLVC